RNPLQRRTRRSRRRARPTVVRRVVVEVRLQRRGDAGGDGGAAVLFAGVGDDDDATVAVGFTVRCAERCDVLLAEVGVAGLAELAGVGRERRGVPLAHGAARRLGAGGVHGGAAVERGAVDEGAVVGLAGRRTAFAGQGSGVHAAGALGRGAGFVARRRVG